MKYEIVKKTCFSISKGEDYDIYEVIAWGKSPFNIVPVTFLSIIIGSSLVMFLSIMILMIKPNILIMDIIFPSMAVISVILIPFVNKYIENKKVCVERYSSKQKALNYIKFIKGDDEE